MEIKKSYLEKFEEILEQNPSEENKAIYHIVMGILDEEISSIKKDIASTVLYYQFTEDDEENGLTIYKGNDIDKILTKATQRCQRRSF